MSEKIQTYIYNAELLDVIDGDTIRFRIDLGFNSFIKTNLRLSGINAPEITGSEKSSGLLVKTRVMELLPNKQVIIESFKTKADKYGRFLARVYLLDGRCLNDVLLEEGLAEKYF